MGGNVSIVDVGFKVFAVAIPLIDGNFVTVVHVVFALCEAVTFSTCFFLFWQTAHNKSINLAHACESKIGGCE